MTRAEVQADIGLRYFETQERSRQEKRQLDERYWSCRRDLIPSTYLKIKMEVDKAFELGRRPLTPNRHMTEEQIMQNFQKVFDRLKYEKIIYHDKRPPAPRGLKLECYKTPIEVASMEEKQRSERERRYRSSLLRLLARA